MIEEPTVARAYTECYVAFIDILGFRKKVEESLLVPSTLNDLVKALEIKPPAQVTTVANPEGDGNWEWWRLQIRAFSDSIVIFLPSKTQRLSLIFYTARYLYDRMLELGLCVRGAITIGDMYWDKSWDPPRGGGSIAGEARADNRKPTITLGPGMINAYELESKRAKFPRILVSDELYQHIETFQPKLYPLMKFGTAGRKLTEFIREGHLEKYRFSG